MTPSEKADAIERDRLRREDELLILLLLLADGLRYEIYRDLRDGLELRYLDTHLDRFAARATREIADSMAQAHRTAYFRLGKFTGGQIGRADADSHGEIANRYQPQATAAATAMADSLRTAVLSGVAEQRQAASSVRVGLASVADTAIAGLSDKAVIKRAFDTAGYTAAHPQALDAGVERAIVGASNSGMLTAVNELPIAMGIRHISVLDERTTDICRERDGLTLPADHPYWKNGGTPPLHWRCVPGDALVSARCRVTGASKRWFDGEMVVIETAANRKLVCTPNHPILTAHGWLAASSLNVGCDVISGGRFEREGLRDGDGENVPARIQDVAESFLGASGMVSVPMPVSPEDFHGDGIGSKIAVVGSNRLLRYADDAAFLKFVLKPLLICGSFPAAVDLMSHGVFELFCRRFLSPLGRLVCSFRQFADLIGRCVAHPRGLLLASIPAFDPVRLQCGGDSVGAASEAFANAAKADATIEHINRLRMVENWRLGMGWSHRHPAFANRPVDYASGDAESAGDIIAGRTGHVSRDKIIHVERCSFHGNVYNLETENGWYIANGIVTHNCRSVLVPVPPSFEQSATLPTVPPMAGFGYGLLPAFAAGTGAVTW